MPHDHHHHSTETSPSIAFFLNLGLTVLEVIEGASLTDQCNHPVGCPVMIWATAFFWGFPGIWTGNRRIGAPRTNTSQASLAFLLGAVVEQPGWRSAAGLHHFTQPPYRILEPQHSNAGHGAFRYYWSGGQWLRRPSPSSGETMNERVVSWHLIEDVLGWVVVPGGVGSASVQDIHHLDPTFRRLLRYTYRIM